VTPVEEKLVQHRLRWFGHMQRRPVEAPIRNGVIRRTSNKKRQSMTKLNMGGVREERFEGLVYHQRASIRDERVEASNSCTRSLIFGSLILLPFVKFFSLSLFHFFDLVFYYLLFFFYLVFYHPLFSPYFWLLWFHL
jgi:hypothetical protein